MRPMPQASIQPPNDPTEPPSRPDVEPSHAPAVIGGSALQIAGHVFAIGITAASTVALTRLLDRDGYGRFTVLTVLLLIGVSVSEFGLNGTAVRWFARGDRPTDVFAPLIGLRLTLSVVAALVALVGFALYPTETPFGAVALTALGIVLAGVSLTIPTALQARLDFRLNVAIDLTGRLVALATYLTALVVMSSAAADSRLVVAALGAPAGYAVAVVVGLACVRRISFPIRPRFDLPTWKRLCRDAAPLGIVTILGLASYRLDALVLALLKDSADVGIYGLAYRFMEASVPLGVFIVAAVFPLLVRAEVGDRRRVLQIARTADLLLVVSVCLVVASIVLAPDIVRVLGGAGYEESVLPLRILSFSLPFTFVGMLFSWTLVAAGLQRRLIPIAAAAVGLNLALNLALVPTYSYRASASITLATEALGTIVLVALAHRWTGASVMARPVILIVLSGILALAAGLALRFAGDVLGGAVAVAVFCVLVVAFGVVTRDEIDVLVRRGR